MTMTPTKFSTMPSRTMVWIEKRPVAKVMTLGGVATGNIKAQEALMAAGIINKAGSVPAPIAAAAKIGISSVVVAMLLVTSVKKVTAKQIVAIINIRGSLDNCSKDSPILALNPDCLLYTSDAADE